jgi:hypothetical protein
MYNKELIEETIKANCDSIGDDYYNYTLEEIEYKSRDGFWSWTNGGFQLRKLFLVSSIHGSGYRFGIKEADDMIEKFVQNAYDYAKEEFVKSNPEYAGKEFDYHSLYAEGKGDLAEKLSEMEMEYMADDQIMVEFGVYFYDADNYHSAIKGKDSIYMYAVINWETPYFRSGKNNEKVLFTKSVEAKNIKRSVPKYLKKALEVFDRIKD